MTCKPPVYMGPEYIKYFSDKTIDVSVAQHNHAFVHFMIVSKTQDKPVLPHKCIHFFIKTYNFVIKKPDILDLI